MIKIINESEGFETPYGAPLGYRNWFYSEEELTQFAKRISKNIDPHSQYSGEQDRYSFYFSSSLSSEEFLQRCEKLGARIKSGDQAEFYAVSNLLHDEDVTTSMTVYYSEPEEDADFERGFVIEASAPILTARTDLGLYRAVEEAHQIDPSAEFLKSSQGGYTYTYFDSSLSRNELERSCIKAGLEPYNKEDSSQVFRDPQGKFEVHLDDLPPYAKLFIITTNV